MAAHSHTRAGNRLSVGPGDQDLPGGSCNYRDLSIGSRAPICGCTRFWLNVSHFNANDGQSERAWCFCGHHACFHNAFSQQIEERDQTLGQARGSNGPLDTDNAGVDAANAGLQDYNTPSKALTGLGIHPGSRSQSQSQSINTRVFRALNEFARHQEYGDNSTSKLPSTNAPSLVDEPRLSPNRFTEDAAQQNRPMAPPVNIPTASAARPAEEYSATEVATPSIAGTPDFRALGLPSSSTRPSPLHLQQARPDLPRSHTEPPAPIVQASDPTNAAERPTTNTIPPFSALEFQNIIETYGRRLDILENLSFSQVPVEELQERFEHFDGRILDLEHWRVDREQGGAVEEHATASSSKRRRLLPTETNSFDSDLSFDRDAAAHAEVAVLATLAANAETHPRIDALETRVQDLENASLPSFARTWQVQVVLLPWSRDLKGVWFSAMDATQHSIRSATQASEEWTGAQSGQNLSFKSSTSGTWTTESIQAWANEAQEWLSPKACGPSGAVFQRLASRGFVRDVELRAPDARHILQAISSAFAGMIGGDVEMDTHQRHVSQHQGLAERFIPLRKVRKSARLRFLSQAEMISSAHWTAPFLDSSVFMKVSDGQRRLYVTTPEAYIQPSGESRWTWKTLRDLPLYEASSDERTAKERNVALEACWNYNDRLDQMVSLHSSFASHESQWSSHSQYGGDDTVALDHQALSPSVHLQPHRQRTVSLPESSAAAEEARDALPKRRVTSFEPIAMASSHLNEHGVDVVAKRRRISTSPEAERRGVNFTPRWSREPPSPFTSELATEARSQGAASGSRKRATTPFAYATPHSNINSTGRLELSGGDGDTEVATDIGIEHSDRGGEEEWEGVQDDGQGHQDEEVNSNGEEQDVDDDDDIEAGLTIYED